MNITWTNGIISLAKDLIFGVSVLTENGWIPLSHLDANDLAIVAKFVDHNPGCPFLTEVYKPS